MTRVLVTGAPGFVGSHLARLLVREGCEVHALIRGTSNTWRIHDILKSISVIHGDLLEISSWQQQLEGIRPEICFHLAWNTVPGSYLTSHDNLRMLSASIDLALRLRKVGCKKLIGAGTCFEYDTDRGYLSETCPTRPRSLYAASKLSLFHVLTQLAAPTDMDFVWARLFHPYGPCEHERRLVPSVICSLLRNEPAKVTSGEQIRDLIHVQDIAYALWALARSDLSGPVNVGSGQPVAVREVAMKIGSLLGRQELVKLGALPTSSSEPMFICADNSVLRKNAEWSPRYGTEEGLRDAVAWWKRHLGLE
jgi:nucleoside-diphosphate-sugar epimerase